MAKLIRSMLCGFFINLVFRVNITRVVVFPTVAVTPRDTNKHTQVRGERERKTTHMLGQNTVLSTVYAAHCRQHAVDLSMHKHLQITQD